MDTTLVRHGDSYALVIDKAFLEALRIDADTPLEVTMSGDVLQVCAKRSDSRQEQLQKVLDKVNARHGKDLKRLAE